MGYIRLAYNQQKIVGTYKDEWDEWDLNLLKFK